VEIPDFDDWVTQRGAALLRFAYLVTRDRSRAEEAVQDALMAAYSHWSRICRVQDPDAYVRRSIVNADISRWRRFFRRETPTSDTGTSAAAPDHRASDHWTQHRAAPDHAVAQAEHDAVWALCATLPPKQRAAVVLRYYEDLPDADIAVILDCSPATVRSQIHRALATLRTTIGTEKVTR
jgi:RNA polymerase sigma-70 factor (sigma-E family)